MTIEARLRGAMPVAAALALAGFLAACSESPPAAKAADLSPTASAPPVSKPQPPRPQQASPSAAVPAAAPAELGLDAEYEKGASLAVAGKLAEARAVFEAAGRQDPGDGAIAAGVAMFRALERGTVSADAVQRIFQAFQKGNDERWQEAHEDVSEAIRLAPKYPRAHSARATLYTLQGQYPNAVGALDEALKLDPEFAEAFYNRGAVRAELQQFDAAIADYTRAIELRPSFWDAYRNRGAAQTHKNNPQAAIADFTKAIELRPREVDPHFLRGVVYAAVAQWDGAMTDFTRVIELDPRHATAYYNRGLGYQQAGDLDRAVAEYSKAAELDPTDPAPLINRGLIHAGRQEYDRAIGDYDKVREIAPDFVLAHFNKAKALDQGGRVQEAITEYRAFVEKSGSSDRQLTAEARQRLAILEKQRRQ